MDKQILWLLGLTLLIVIKDVVAPMVKKIINLRNNKKEEEEISTEEQQQNPINLDRFYQSFIDFTEKIWPQWKKSIEDRLEKLEKGRE